MRGKEIDLVFFVKDILGAVTVMYIPVHNQDPMQLVLSDCMLRSYSHIVDQAEPHRLL